MKGAIELSRATQETRMNWMGPDGMMLELTFSSTTRGTTQVKWLVRPENTTGAAAVISQDEFHARGGRLAVNTSATPLAVVASQPGPAAVGGFRMSTPAMGTTPSPGTPPPPSPVADSESRPAAAAAAAPAPRRLPPAKPAAAKRASPAAASPAAAAPRRAPAVVGRPRRAVAMRRLDTTAAAPAEGGGWGRCDDSGEMASVDSTGEDGGGRIDGDCDDGGGRTTTSDGGCDDDSASGGDDSDDSAGYEVASSDDDDDDDDDGGSDGGSDGEGETCMRLRPCRVPTPRERAHRRGNAGSALKSKQGKSRARAASSREAEVAPATAPKKRKTGHPVSATTDTATVADVAAAGDWGANATAMGADVTAMLAEYDRLLPEAKAAEAARAAQRLQEQARARGASNLKKPKRPSQRPDLKVMETLLKTEVVRRMADRGKVPGHVTGVPIGAVFSLRVLAKLAGVHGSHQAGIATGVYNGVRVATAICQGGGYGDNSDKGEVLMYTGAGGNAYLADKHQIASQSMENPSNAALQSSLVQRTPVRVLREIAAKTGKTDGQYRYDGLYAVLSVAEEWGIDGFMVFKFELRRLPAQPPLGEGQGIAWRGAQAVPGAKIKGVVCDDLSGGKERYPVLVINTTGDNAAFPHPTDYTTTVEGLDKIPDLKPAAKCICVGKCGHTCPTVQLNGGKAYVNGLLDLSRTVDPIYECGPESTCGPSCPNRLVQRGFGANQLSVQRTPNRGWGVYAGIRYPAGGLVIHYTGKIMTDGEANSVASDVYLFGLDPGNDGQAGGEGRSRYAIDGGDKFSLGRFLNHSCDPNCIVKRVLWDHGDNRVPNIVIFAQRRIEVGEELTYDYNYELGSVKDAEGRVRTLKCLCGSENCRGRLY